VDSYKDLNAAKFAVIRELENQLPVALFRREWWVCGHNRKKREKPVEDVYVPLTHLERWIPVAFAALYLVLGAYALLARMEKEGCCAASSTHTPAATTRTDTVSARKAVNTEDCRGFDTNIKVMSPMSWFGDCGGHL
jgi:hypothetical protein